MSIYFLSYTDWGGGLFHSTFHVDISYEYDCCVQITKLKIDSNPFAKGFRDSVRLGNESDRC